MAQREGGPAVLVNPLIGTANDGNTFPGAVLPFGMLAWSPEEISPKERVGYPPGGYRYDASEVRGFSLTHLSGAGCAGSGDVLFMPITQQVAESPSLDQRDARYLSTLAHEDESARAGYYRVRLGNGVLAELTASTRAGVGRFAFPAGAPAVMLVRTSDGEVDTADAHVAIDAERRVVRGWVTSGDFCGHARAGDTDSYYTLYFVAHFDQPFAGHGTWRDGAVSEGGTTAGGGTSLGAEQHSTAPAAGRGSGAYVEFARGAVVQVRVGISYVSAENAEANLRAEIPDGTSFEAVRRRARVVWNRALGQIDVRGGTEEQRVVFYTALYHSLLHMNVASDVSGKYRGMDGKVHAVAASQRAQYANFSGWDTYRSQVQLVTWLDPRVGSDMAQSLLNQANEWGCWSRWTHNTGATNVMNGDPSAAAVAAIVAFGGTRFDVKGAYRSLLDAAMRPHEEHRCSRPRVDQWMALHYVPSMTGRHDTSVADTLEFCTADFALAQLAETAGDRQNADALMRRAQFWKNLYDPSAGGEGYLRPKDASGAWRPFAADSKDGFVEGTAAQYVWMTPFNARGLFAAMGGEARASRRLDDFFHDAGGAWAFTSGGTHPGLDNEPVLETPWLYDFAGKPYKTQQTVRAVMDALWKNAPDGIPGNDDLGEMSSWFVWAALGMYPVIPGRAEVVLGAPLFAEATVRRAGGDFHIVARRADAKARYVRGLSVDGAAWTKPWLPADVTLHRALLKFDLGDLPDAAWGSKREDAPPSFDVQ